MGVGTAETRAHAHVHNSPGPESAERRREEGTARPEGGGPCLELPERAESASEIAEGGLLEGNVARGFDL